MHVFALPLDQLKEDPRNARKHSRRNLDRIKASLERFGQQTPMGRAGQPAEVATAFVFLASPESSYVTGEVLAVTGGGPVTM